MFDQPVTLFDSVQSFVIAGMAIAGIVQLGFVVFFSDTQNASNRLFLFASLSGATWGVLNFLVFEAETATLALWLLRTSVIFAVIYSLFLYLFYANYPSSNFALSNAHQYIAFGITAVLSCLLLTPLIFGPPVRMLADSIVGVTNGPAIPLLVAGVFYYIFGGLLFLTKRMRVERDPLARRQIRLILIGSTITYGLILVFNLVFPAAFKNTTYVPLAGIWMLPMLGMMTYAIVRHHLFNARVFAAQAIVLALDLILLLQVFYSDQKGEFFFRVFLFFLVLGTGVLLVRSVLKEIQQREVIESQRAELERMNNQQERFLHFISHEVKGYLTDGQNAFAAIVEGDLGKVAPQVWSTSTTALAKMREGVQTIMDILAASNMKAGTVTYRKEPFDFHETFENAIEIMRPRVAEKGLKLDVSIVEGDYTFVGDKEKIEHHVIRNLVDNAIRYTPQGTVTITLKREKDHIRFTVKDTGVGITEEDKPRLFTEGGHGKDSIKVNVNSTGYGLYVAKQVIEAHGGTIRAESAGAGKGAEFIVELPVSTLKS